MPRVAVQPDLFAPEIPASALRADPVAELTNLLDRLRAAHVAPWPDAAGAMAEEHRALGLARQAGEKGASLANAIFRETERLLSLSD